MRGTLRLLDQTLLPGRVRFRTCRRPRDVWDAIRRLQVRGAPAIGVAGAYGVFLGARGEGGSAGRDGGEAVAARAARAAAVLATARPTAVNLSWAVRRMARAARGARALPRDAALARLLEEAHAILREDRAACDAIGRHGAPLVRDGRDVVTHCNAGGLATTGTGTALAVLYAAAAAGRRFRVYVDETRPLLQGARLTAWELSRAGLRVILQCDGMSASLLRAGGIGCCVVGADRIARNGDTANKIGTYALALAARAHRVPFYVAAPLSTIDPDCPDGDAIPIEERDAREVVRFGGVPVAPGGIGVRNPAFDVTPHALITAIVTERGVLRPPFSRSIRAALRPRVKL